MTSKSQLPKLFRQWDVRVRTVIAISIATIVFSSLPKEFSWATEVLCVWDAGMVSFLSTTLWVMWQATPAQMRRYAQHDDPGRLVILGLITIASCISIFAIVFVLHNKGTSGLLLFLHLVLSITTIVGSWLLVHTIFALHYARAYYQDHKTLRECKAEGLDFPGELEPDYGDFLYFALVIGMTSQVSDVEITSRSMRRLSLLHSVLSFFFNTTILAMSINIIAGLI